MEDPVTYEYTITLVADDGINADTPYKDQTGWAMAGVEVDGYAKRSGSSSWAYIIDPSDSTNIYWKIHKNAN